MTEPLGEEATEQPSRNKFLIGGGALVLVGVAAAFLSGGGSGSDLKWSRE